MMIFFKHKISNYDLMILAATVMLCLIGILSVYTTSCRLGILKHEDALYYLKNHLRFMAIGILSFIMISSTDIKNLKDKNTSRIPLSYLLLVISFVFLILVFVPGIGYKAGNAKRWINLVFFKFQPSELLKVCLCIFYANYFVKYSRTISNIRYGLFIPFAIFLPFVLLLVLQPDLGTFIILCGWLCGMLFVAGVNLTYPIIIGASGLILGGLFVYMSGYNLTRLLVHFDPWKDPLGKGFQPIHSMYAFASGGLTGRGPGESLQKLFYLPEAHTDYALAVMAEEFGFVMVLLVAFLYGIIIFKGITIATHLSDQFKRYLCWGITSLFGLQVMVNMGVVTALFPPKGLTLPFISYGGSSLLFSFIMVGILMNLSMEQRESNPVATRAGLIPFKGNGFEG